MKKRIIKALAAVIAATFMVGSLSLAAEAGNRRNYYRQMPTASVTEQDALAIAYADAGVNAADATLTKSKLEYDDGYLEYDFTFYAGGYKYEYEIDATNGSILDREKKYSNKYGTPAQPAQPTQPTQPTQPAQPVAGITAQDALNIALADAGFAESNVRVKENKLKTKKWGSYYEVEFYAGWLEYEYDIDASTGAILKKDIDD